MFDAQFCVVSVAVSVFTCKRIVTSNFDSISLMV